MGAPCFYNPFFLFLRRWWVIVINFVIFAGFVVLQVLVVPFLPLWLPFLVMAILGLVTCCNTGCGCEPDECDHHDHHHQHHHQSAPVVQYQYVPPPGPGYQQGPPPMYQQPNSAPSVPPPAYGSAGTAAPPPYASAPSVSEWNK